MTFEYSVIVDNVLDDDERKLAENYFAKYWLPVNELRSLWLPMRETAFRSSQDILPDMVFNPEYVVFPKIGGDIFTSIQDFSRLKSFFEEIGDVTFAVLQNPTVETGIWRDGGFLPDPERRFHYPSKISWNELMSGGVVGCEHFNNGRKDYFLFGDQGKWGRYVANCWLKPIHTLPTPLIFDGVLLEYLPQFQQSYTRIPLSAQERDDRLLIESWLPSEYLSDSRIITLADSDGVPVLPITTA